MWLNFEESVSGKTKDTLAQIHYGHMTYDTALPHTWVVTMRSRGFEHPQDHFVWLYTEGSRMGYPAPLTREGVEMLMKVGAWI